ncbi:MAG: hypothetical protein ACLTSX_05190 [Collinsella sp.]
MTDGAAAIGLRSTPVAPSRASIASALDARHADHPAASRPSDFTTSRAFPCHQRHGQPRHGRNPGWQPQ